MPDSTFASIGLSADIVRVLTAQGIDAPFQIQTRAIPAALAGQDVLAKAPTGSGKTLAFAIPIVERIAARRRTARRARPRPDARARGPGDRGARRPRQGARASRSPPSTAASRSRPRPRRPRRRTSSSRRPGRLQDLMDRRMVNLDAVTILVLDEADRMLDMGFKPQVDKILRRVSDNRQTMFFSATLDGAVGELARAYTNQPVRIEAELPSEHQPGEIDHQFVSVTRGQQGREARRAAPGGARPRTRLRPHEARRRPARPAPRAPSGARGRDARRQDAGRPREGARALRGRQGDDADRHRRRRPRARPLRHHARDQLRSARGREGLHAPRRPHRPRRPLGHGRHARAPRPAGRGQPRRAPERPVGRVGGDRHEGRPPRSSSTRAASAAPSGAPPALAGRSREQRGEAAGPDAPGFSREPSVEAARDPGGRLQPAACTRFDARRLGL